MTTYDPKNVDWGKTRRSQNKVVNAMSGTWGPIVAAASAPALVRSMVTAPIATMATMAGGATGGYAVDKASETLTGQDFGTNIAMNTPLSPDLGEAVNPGAILGGMYGNFVGNNIANRERYTLNYLNPVSYKGHLLDLPLTISKPFYEKPPTFTGGRKPVWYSKYAKEHGTQAAENRFQNGAIWAGISEDEIPITMYEKNMDGTYRMTHEGINPNLQRDALVVPDGTWTEADDLKGVSFKGNTTISPDHITAGKIGGEHSDHTILLKNDKGSLMQFEDEQKLNPQWVIASGLKNILGIDDNSRAGRFVDYFGGMPLDNLVGYKPFTIKQNYFHDGNTVYPIFQDPNGIVIP